jgi:hypothetical protein
VAPTDETRKYVIANYVQPARGRGDDKVKVRVGNVLKELGWTNRTPSVYSTLSSVTFQREAGVQLIEKRGGPTSGGPSTTVEFLYRILYPADAEQTVKTDQTPVPNGAGLEALYGIFADTYAGLGGGETYLKAERNWGPDAWQRYEEHERTRPENNE